MENPGVLAEGLVLKEPVKGEQPPPDTRRHGNTNLLHRSVKNNSLIYLSKNINYKDKISIFILHICFFKITYFVYTSRATSCGNYTIVKELLKTGYRHDTKNHEGQTAVHLASLNGKDDILRKLISHGANINTRDTAGYTPLHVSFVKLIFYIYCNF